MAELDSVLIFTQVVNDAHRILAEFLTTELALASTFLEIAKTSNNIETVQRNQMNARTAYETVRRYLRRAHLTKAEQHSIHDKLAKLKERLDVL